MSIYHTLKSFITITDQLKFKHHTWASWGNGEYSTFPKGEKKRHDLGIANSKQKHMYYTPATLTLITQCHVLDHKLCLQYAKFAFFRMNDFQLPE